MIISNNLTAMNAMRQWNIVGKSKAKSTEKLSSGYRINRAADDAAGLAISEKMRRQINGLNRGAENIQDGISLVMVADGALSEVHDILNRMNELSVKSANGTLSSEDRSYIQEEVNSLVSEINRIAKDTTFNEINLFDDEEYYKELDIDNGPITKLIASESADYGYLHESYQKGGKYYAAAYLDFSAVNESNISKLNGGNFKFWCSIGCNEIFDISFTTDGTPSSAKNLSGKVQHEYSVDISNCKNGSDIVSAIYSYVSSHLPSTSSESATSNPGGVKVSHSNNLIKQGDKLAIVSNYKTYSSSEDASTAYKGGDISGKITCSSIYSEEKIPPKYKRPFEIQCSSESGDIETVNIYRMNGKLLGIDPLDVSTSVTSSESIDKIKKAHADISEHRSLLGAEQNRLEHAYKINVNVAENTTAAESLIRDTDMAKEMVSLSLNNVLDQAGQSVLSSANQNAEMVLSLLK